MKKYIILFLSILAIAGCVKEQEFKTPVFPGFTGNGDEAIWVVNNHTITDKAYVTGVLALQTPPSTLGKFDSSYVLARYRETSIYAYKFHKGGEVSLILKSSLGVSSWVKQPFLKWQEVGDQIMIDKNNNGTWTNIIIGFKDQNRLLFRFKKTYFGDTSTDQERVVMEVLYSIFKIN